MSVIFAQRGTFQSCPYQLQLFYQQGLLHSIANSSLFPTFMYLHLNSTKILALKKPFFSLFRVQIYLLFFCKKSIMQLFSADASAFKKKLNSFFDHEKVKKRASKDAHNRPRPFYFTVQPRPQPTAQNWFFILRNLGTRHLFSYLWFTSQIRNKV